MLTTNLIAYFFGGVFFANFVPHFVSGIMGRRFPTPFASPPFRGPSLPRTNILYGFGNLVVAYVVVSRVGTFDPRSALHAAAFGIGLAVWALFVARSLGRAAAQKESSG